MSMIVSLIAVFALVVFAYIVDLIAPAAFLGVVVPYSAFAVWLKTDEGVEVFKSIDKKLK